MKSRMLVAGSWGVGEWGVVHFNICDEHKSHVKCTHHKKKIDKMKSSDCLIVNVRLCNIC